MLEQLRHQLRVLVEDWKQDLADRTGRPRALEPVRHWLWAYEKIGSRIWLTGLAGRGC